MHYDQGPISCGSVRLEPSQHRASMRVRSNDGRARDPRTRKGGTPMPETAGTREVEAQTSRREPSRPAQPEETEQLVVTIGATSGEVVKIEKIDKAGKRDDLS